MLVEMLDNPYYQRCIRNSGCRGRITLEHALKYSGRQINEIWAIVPVCAYHHCVDQYQDCGDMDKRFHEYVAISRMTAEDRKKYPRRDWLQDLKFLKTRYEGKGRTDFIWKNKHTDRIF